MINTNTLLRKLWIALIICIASPVVNYAQVTHLVISQVYGAGGNSGAAYNTDYIELFNPTNASVTATNWSIQYASASGTTWQVATFSGIIPAGGYFLVRGASGANGAPIPTPDFSPAVLLNLSGTTGKVALCSNNTTLSGSCPSGGAIVDFVGFGTANCFETSVAPAPSTANAIFRIASGCTDNDNNGTDFLAAPASPRNSSSALNSCGGVTGYPSIACNVTITRMTLDESVISFFGGNGSERMVVMREGGAVTFVPADSQTYSGWSNDITLAADQGDNNRIVHLGTGNTVAVYGLALNTFYGIKVIEYNGATSEELYFITTDGSASLTTPGYLSYNAGFVYSQDFNTLPQSGIVSASTNGFGQGPYFLNSPPVNAGSVTGWQFANTLFSDARIITDNGSGTSGSAYIYGSSASADRALGSLSSSTVIPATGITFTNASAVPLTEVSISFDGEQWRNGGSGAPNQLKVQYAIGSSHILNGVFTDVPSLHFNSPVVSASAGPLDGNDIANRLNLSATFNLDSNWLPGENLTIRFLDGNETGNDDGLSIDNFTFSAIAPVAPSDQDSMLTFTNILSTSMDVNWLNGDGSNRIVVMNTVNSFTSPVDGNTYSANAVYSGNGEQVIYNGSGSNVQVTNLNVGTTYYFRVFAYNGMDVATAYNIASATDNPASQSTSAAVPPTQLAFIAINGGNPVFVNTPFSVTVESQDANGGPQNVINNTTVTLSLTFGFGNLSGNLSGVINAGSSSVTISGIIYDTPETQIELSADATSGDVLAAAFSAPFTVLDVATYISASYSPSNIVSTIVDPIQASAMRLDASVDPYYNQNAVIAMISGPGLMSGTLTKQFVNGVATFDDLSFDAVGTYELEITSGSLSPVTFTFNVVNPPMMNELVIPFYLAGKTSSSTNTNRVPFIACISFDYLLANTSYNLSAGLEIAGMNPTSIGAGTLWNGTQFSSQPYSNAFTTDANGSSGPVWIAIQPSANTARFGPGQFHTLRTAVSEVPFAGPIDAQFTSSSGIMALDISSNAFYSPSATDDGAFLTGVLDSCFSGKFVVLYNDTSGLLAGQPLTVGAAVTSPFPNPSQTSLPLTIDQILTNTASTGSFAGVIPSGSNNPAGVRLIEVRDMQNNLLNSITDADGIWPSGANTTTAARVDIVTLQPGDLPLNTITSLTTSVTDATCYQGTDGTALAHATSLAVPLTYSWQPSGGTDSLATGLSAGSYTVTVADANGCAKSAVAVVGEAPSFNPVAGNDGPDCIGDSIQLSASGGLSYTWSGPNGFSSNDQNPLLITDNADDAGVYSVVVTNGDGCTETATTTVILNDCSCTVPDLIAIETNVDCNGNASGSIDLIVSGGQAPYSYLWSNGEITEDISGLISGVYTVTVTESLGCTATLTITITEPNPLVLQSDPSDPTCTGSDNGSIDLSISGGVDPYVIQWSNGMMTEDLTNILAGTYTVTVTDNNQCQMSLIQILMDPPAFTVSVDGIANIACHGGADGAINISASNDTEVAPSDPGLIISEFSANPPGTDSPFEWVELIATRNIDFSVTPYTVVFANNGTANVNGWIAGGTTTYAFEITSGSVAQGQVAYVGGSSMTPVGAKLRVINTSTTGGDGFGNANSTGVLGNGGTCDGIAVFALPRVSVTNSTTPVDAIMFGTFQPVVSAGTAGYKLPVNDNYNGGFVQSTSFKGPEPLNGGTTQATGVYNYELGVFTTPRVWTNLAALNNNGLSDVVLTNSNTYIWSNGATSQDISNLATGTYTVTASNIAGCTASITVTVTQPQDLVINVSYDSIACFGESTVVNYSATGGTPLYNFSGPSPVSAGTHTAYVTDANGCMDSIQFHVTQPAQLSITGFSPSAAPVGSTISINGTGFTGTTQVIFSTSGPATSYNVTHVTKNNTHPYFGIGSAHGFAIDGIQGMEITLYRGVTYTFNVMNTVGHPFVITTSAAGGFANSGSVITSGVVNSGTTNGQLLFTPNNTHPALLYYQCNVHDYMGYRINIVDPPASGSFTVISDTVISATVPSNAITGPVTIITDCDTLTSSGVFTIGATTANLDLTVFLQGYYSGAGQMTPALFNQGVSSDPMEADSVTLELHEAVSPFGFVHSVTSVLNVNGDISFTLPSFVNGNTYYLVLLNRNHIQTWSKDPVTFGASTSYDFTVPVIPKQGSGGGQNISSGR